jgi:hypothetical protein
MAEDERYPASIRLIAGAFGVPTAQVGAMLVRWRTQEDLTYQQIADRLATKDAGLSPSRVAEVILKAQGADRPPIKPRPWARKEHART